MEIALYGTKLARSAAWSKHGHTNHRVTEETFVDVFQQIYDTLERQPTITLEAAAEQILAQLERK